MNSQRRRRLQGVLTTAHHDFEKGLNLHAFFRLPDRNMSQDLVQETFMKTWGYLLRGGKVDVMKAFLYHILNHLIIDEYRKRKMLSLDTLLEQGFEPSVDQSERLINVMDGRTALLLIQRLPTKYQRVMRMRYVQDLSLKEMSTVTGQSKNSLAVQVHRGLQKLKLLYQST